MEVPIYRAKKIDSDEYVEGYLMSCGSGSYCVSMNVNNLFLFGKEFKIDQSTLEISLDGENWKSMKDLEEMFIFDNEMMKIDIDAGGRVK